MPKYYVTLSRKAFLVSTFEVEALDERNAEELVSVAIKNDTLFEKNSNPSFVEDRYVDDDNDATWGFVNTELVP